MGIYNSIYKFILAFHKEGFQLSGTLYPLPIVQILFSGLVFKGDSIPIFHIPVCICTPPGHVLVKA